jgi:hypothetical protein
MAKEGVLQATTIKQHPLFSAGTQVTDRVRAVWPVSGENAKDYKQEN